MCYQIYAKDWLIPCLSVISTNYKEQYSPPHTWWLSHTTDVTWQATAAVDIVISPKACPSSRIYLPSASRLMLQTSQQICLGYDEWNSEPCLWGVLFWALSDNIHQFHPGKHYFTLDLGRHNWLTRKGHCTLPENDSKVLRVSCHYLTKFHNRESTGDCGQINDLPSKIQFSDSHCAPFCSQFFFFCHLSKTINLADSLVSGHQHSHSIITLGFWSLLMFMMLFWALVFYSYFCHSLHILMNCF